MASILIFPTSTGVDLETDQVVINGETRVQGQAEPVSWGVAVAWGSTTQQINNAIITAAEAAVVASGVPVGGGDRKIVLGGGSV